MLTTAAATAAGCHTPTVGSKAWWNEPSPTSTRPAWEVRHACPGRRSMSHPDRTVTVMAEPTVAELDAPRGWRVRHRVHRSIVREEAAGYDQPMLLHAPAAADQPSPRSTPTDTPPTDTPPTGAPPAGAPRADTPPNGIPADPRPEAPPAQEADEVADRLERLARELQSLAAAPVVTTETVAIDRCFARLKLVDGALAALRARLTTAAVRSDAPAERGERDSTTYLRNRLGISGREARRRAELARGLEALPQTAAALAEGRIGEEQAAAIARASRSGRLGSAEQVDEELLAVAERETPESLGREIRRREHLADADALRRDENRAFARRRCTSRRRKDGMWDIDATLDALNGELVDRMFRAFTQPDPADTPPERRRSPEQRLADGLIAAAHSALSGGDAPQDGGVRPHVTVYAPIEAFAGIPGAVATTEGGVVISPEALTRLGCDACLAFVLTRGPSQVLHSGRATRNWPGPTRRAIIVRDVHCRFPGCSVPASRSVIHHVRYYSNGGETSIDNGVLICIFHHRLVHEGRWRLGLDPATAEVTVTSPTGRVLRGRPPPRGPT